MKTTRQNKLREQMRIHHVNCIALVPGPNMEYLSGIHSHVSERPIVLFFPVAAEPAIIIPGLEAMKAEAAGILPERIFAWSDEEGYLEAFQHACTQLDLSNNLLAVESLHMRVLEYELLRKFVPELQTTAAEPMMSALRAVKNADEIAKIEQAIAVAQQAMERLVPEIKIGMTEKQVAAMLTRFQFEAGADSIAFGPIVSAGPNGASPHAIPTERPLQEGDLLVIDWGCYVDGYPSDITRTFAVGEIDETLRHVYETVKLANEQGVLAAGPDATGDDIDSAARDVIEDSNFGEFFTHRTGHGLGLEIHEPPFMMSGNHELLVPGNVFTVEPGIYLPGKAGVRIEDDILITEDGYRSLTTFPRDLIQVG